MQVFLIPFFICLTLPAAIIGFLWQFICQGFIGGTHFADSCVESIDD